MENTVRGVSSSESDVEALRARVAQLQTALGERTWVEAGINESNERYRNLFENLNDAAFLISADDGAILAANRRAEALLGRPRTQLLGRHHAELYPAACANDQCRLFDSVAGRGGSLDFEGDLLTSQGAAVPVRFSAASLALRGQHMLLALASDITPRKRAEEALRAVAQEKTAILDSMSEFVTYHDPSLRVQWVNRAAARFAGISSEAATGRHCFDVWHGLSEPCPGCPCLRSLESGAPEEAELTFPNGSIRMVRGYPVKSSAGQVTGLVEVAQEITAQRHAEEKLRRTNRAFRTLSSCNQALVRASDEFGLLNDMCRKIVEVGGYRLTWVGMVQDDSAHTVRPVAQAGFEDGYLALANITWSDNERGSGPMGRAIRTGLPQVARDITFDARFAPWREEALQRGYSSTIALPLVIGGAVVGGLGIYAAESDAFDDDELELLKELAGDMSFGIQGVRTRAGYVEAQALLQSNQHFVQRLLDVTADLCFVLDLELRSYVYVNRRCVELLGYTTREVRAMGSRYLERLVHPDDQAYLRKFYARMVHAADGDVTEHEYRVRHRLGDWRLFRERLSVYARRPDGAAYQVIGAARDITPAPLAARDTVVPQPPSGDTSASLRPEAAPSAAPGDLSAARA